MQISNFLFKFFYYSFSEGPRLPLGGEVVVSGGCAWGKNSQPAQWDSVHSCRDNQLPARAARARSQADNTIQYNSTQTQNPNLP